MNSSNTDFPIEVRGLSRKFGTEIALAEVDLQLERGGVLGLIGVNGAGKTTLIKHLIGALRAKQGTVQIFGRDPTVAPELTLARIGYMSEEDSLPTWMGVDGLMRYHRDVYPTWDQAYADRWCNSFSIDANKSLASMSKGGRARVALMLAISHRPELLILDEPSSGLDPIARRDILEMVVRSLGDLGTTVLFSSHLLGEVARVCDKIAVIGQGHLEPPIQWTEIQARYQRFVLTNVDEVPAGEGILSVNTDGDEWVLIATDDCRSRWSPQQIVEETPLTLDDYFAAVSGSPTQPAVSGATS